VRRIIPVLVAVGVVAGSAVLIARPGPCDVLAERGLFDVVMDFDASGGKPTIEQAVEAAFAEAGMPRQVSVIDLDPIVLPHPDGNMIHVGVDGYWISLATVQRGEGGAFGTPHATEDGFVPLDPPRRCSVLVDGA
jgi:hypothetical protein